MTRADFIARFGGVYEASPWVAEACWPPREDLPAAMRAVVDAAPRERKLALIRAHPELASRAKMADASVQEQAGAGLDQCSAEEFAAFQGLNAAYNARFGFPFIIAVKGLTRHDILDAFETRINHTATEEFATACREVEKIARLRLAAIDLGG